VTLSTSANAIRYIRRYQVDTRKRNLLHVSADGASSEVVSCIIKELKRRRLNVKKMINARDKYIGGELCMLIRGKDKGRDSWHYVEVSRGLMDIFMKKTRGGTIDVAKYGTLLFSGWGPDPDDDTAQVFLDQELLISCRYSSKTSSCCFSSCSCLGDPLQKT